MNWYWKYREIQVVSPNQKKLNNYHLSLSTNLYSLKISISFVHSLYLCRHINADQLLMPKLVLTIEIVWKYEKWKKLRKANALNFLMYSGVISPADKGMLQHTINYDIVLLLLLMERHEAPQFAWISIGIIYDN
jgi:hypothetical protein